jgi:acetyl-CoA synthetase
VGVPDDLKGEAVAVFVVLRPGHEPSEPLRAAILEAITGLLGKPLRPRAVLFSTVLPKTRNGKIMRRVVRAAHLALPDLGDLSGLENPATVEAIRQAR